jgi:hypothetical protein
MTCVAKNEFGDTKRLMTLFDLPGGALPTKYVGGVSDPEAARRNHNGL